MKIVISKADLDTCLAGLIFGVRRTDQVVVVDGEAAANELLDSQVLCIESGGSGQLHLNNFDHHDPSRYFPPACRQVQFFKRCRNKAMERLVDYVCRVDEALPLNAKILFPALSSLFSGMKIVVRHPAVQFRKGMQILEDILKRQIDPFGTMPNDSQWDRYILAKQSSNARLDADLNRTVLFLTRKGVRSGFARSCQPGVLGRLYHCRCQVAVAFDPSRSKYTIGSREIELSPLLPLLNAADTGWGGRVRIIGSPTGSCLTEREVVQIVQSGL